MTFWLGILGQGEYVEDCAECSNNNAAENDEEYVDNYCRDCECLSAFVFFVDTYE